jgi:hypothetical protein
MEGTAGSGATVGVATWFVTTGDKFLVVGGSGNATWELLKGTGDGARGLVAAAPWEGLVVETTLDVEAEGVDFSTAGRGRGTSPVDLELG